MRPAALSPWAPYSLPSDPRRARRDPASGFLREKSEPPPGGGGSEQPPIDDDELEAVRDSVQRCSLILPIDPKTILQWGVKQKEAHPPLRMEANSPPLSPWGEERLWPRRLFVATPVEDKVAIQMDRRTFRGYRSAPPPHGSTEGVFGHLFFFCTLFTKRSYICKYKIKLKRVKSKLLVLRYFI